MSQTQENGFNPTPLLDDILAPRKVTNDFRWASRSWTPSPYFSRGKPRDIKEICQQVLQSEAVINAIKEVAKMEGKEDAEVQKRAQDVIQEMSHNFHLYAVRWFGLVLSKLGKKLYSSIYVNKEKLEEIRSGFERYPVIFLPTHRSYVDFLLLSYVCFTYSLPLPIIAAGMDFMNMTGVAELLRKSGAFFIRRRFGNDILYWAIITEYVSRTLLQGGHPMEIFIEGTRSRTGKSLPPKTGLLTTILELVRTREIPDILILPISMSYDRTLEETLYAHELLGQPKPKESTNGLLRALRWLGSQQYGSIYVNFGNFISVNQFLGLDTLYPVDDRIFSKGVRDMSIQVIISHQENIAVPLFSAVATVALTEISQGKKSITFPQLMSYIVGFQKLLTARGLAFGCPYPHESLDKNVQYLLTNVHIGLVTFAEVDQRVWFNVDEDNEVIACMQLQHYSNQLVYLLAPFCLASLITSTGRREMEISSAASSFEDLAISPNQDHIQQYTYFRQLFSEEFVCQRGVELMEIMFAAETWNSLVLRRDSNSNFSIDPMNLRRCLKRALAPFFIAYWGLASTLVQLPTSSLTPEPLDIKSFGKLCQTTLRDKLGKQISQYYGALSLDCMNNAIMSLINSGGLARAKVSGSTAPGFIVHDLNQISTMRTQLGKYLCFVDLILSASEIPRNKIEMDSDSTEIPSVSC
ncbi:unnamed protein product [Orchesella dallaii]|uniref:Phospholipid/glycerol acyltransferase domain-containing protein n=1 Tax=Orchesella dallaii TaxID=48710 RepID=A0ABP1Q1D4_9HEXA